MRKISIFGATGSIGESAFDLLMHDGGADRYDVLALTGGRNTARLAEMARALRADIAVTAFDDCLPDLREQLAGSGIKAAAGTQAIAEAADRPSDWALSGIIGAAGLMPGLRVLARGGTLALANKETLVTAGPLVMGLAQQHQARILPVDSEHSALFQCLDGENIDTVSEVVITASGGAFRDWPLARLEHANVAEASTHPNWAMGQRITIDSASMFNKALEVIEAYEFFDLKPDQIKVLVHPESIIHALVSHHDGGTIAHLGMPDMRHAIGYALHWPKRMALPVPRLDLAAQGGLTFMEPDLERWPALRLGRDVMKAGGAAGAVFNAAKEQALDDFIAGHIRFTQMAQMVEYALERLTGQDGFFTPPDDLETVLFWDRAGRDMASMWKDTQ